MKTKEQIENENFITYVKCPKCLSTSGISKSVNEDKYHCYHCDNYFTNARKNFDRVLED